MSPAAVATSYLLAVLLGQTPKPANDNGDMLAGLAATHPQSAVDARTQIGET